MAGALTVSMYSAASYVTSCCSISRHSLQLKPTTTRAHVTSVQINYVISAARLLQAGLSARREESGPSGMRSAG